MIAHVMSPSAKKKPDKILAPVSAAAAVLSLIAAIGISPVLAHAQVATATVEAGPAQVVTRAALKALTSAAPAQIPLPTAPIAARPTMDPAAYEAAKAAAAQPDPAGKPAEAGKGGKAPSLLAPPIVQQIQYDGVGMAIAGNLTPPDTHGAAGKNHYCQVVNSYIKCFQKGGTNSVVLASTLNAFVGYATQTLFDPRIIYDATWNRWVFTSAAFAENATTQRFFIAVSKDASPTHGWYIYSLNVAFVSGGFWDYASLGMDQDSIIFAANFFVNDSYSDSKIFAVAKARLYNGLGFSVPLFQGLVGTLQPPIVLDQDANAYVVAASDGATGTITKYTLRNSSRAFAATLDAATITVPAWSVPPPAAQPNSAATLDTLDARFQNASTQNGGMIWQTHTTAYVGYPAPLWYQLNGQTNTLVTSGRFFVFPGSYDWNPSIAANTSGDIFLNWSMTCPSASLGACPNGQLTVRARFSGKLAGDASVTGNAGGFGNSGANVYVQTDGRFGDYSAVTLDPTNPNMAWITNEVITSTSTWGSRIARIGF